VSLSSIRRIGKPRKWNQIRGIVDPRALERYLAQPNKNHEYVKKFTRKNILDGMPALEMWTKPRLHQLQCFYLTTYYKALLLYLPMGAGKTKIMLDTIRFRKKYHGLRSVLVLTLNLISAKTWADECDVHAPDLTYQILDGTKLERIAALEASTADIVITNYHSLPMLLCDSIGAASSTGQSKRYKWKYNSDYMRRFIPRFQAMVIDEIHMFSGYTGLFWRLADHIGQRLHYRYGLSGTPFGRDPLPVFGQFKLIDHGETFGREINWFRVAFYDYKKGWFGGKWVYNEKMEPDLSRMVRNRSITYKMDEITDLPSLTMQTISCTQTKAMKTKYDVLVRQILHKTGKRTLRSSFVNLRQLTSGYQTIVGSDDPEREQLELLGFEKQTKSFVEFSRNPKMEALLGLLGSLPESEKVLVFCEYRHTVEMISETLTAEKIKHVTLYGGTPDKVVSLDQFYQNDTIRVAVANNVTASMSINPQYVCHYGIFFENSVRPDVRQQAESRLHRPGQEYPVFLYDIVIADSVDQRIGQWLSKGKNLLQAVLYHGPKSEMF
jgi:SNF2 family DNA or RNA helicase